MSPQEHSNSPDTCNADSIDLSQGIKRREFLGQTLLGAAAAALVRLPLYAGPYAAEELANLIPADKKLRPEWVKSLFARGERTRYTKARDELRYIGMPVGGLCCGMLYLGGDGKLWLWDIFNRNQDGVIPKTVDFKGRKVKSSDGSAYVEPNLQTSPLEQGFALKTTSGGKIETRTLDAKGWAEVAFTGEYPIGFVEYRDPSSAVTVDLEAFSPFIPLHADDSSLPVTVMRFTIRNTSQQPVAAELAGWLENAVGLNTAQQGEGIRRNRIVRSTTLTLLECSAEETPQPEEKLRPEIVFEDFEKPDYARWEVSGTAFGTGPVLKSAIPAYQGEVGGEGQRVVNTHASAPGNDVGARDSAIGRLTSTPFKIERKFIVFYVGGGSHKGSTSLNLLMDGQVVRTATGQDNNRMRRDRFDVRELEGQTVRLEIVDEERAGWGNIGVDQIVFTDAAPKPPPFAERPDFGTMALALLKSEGTDFTLTALSSTPPSEAVFATAARAEDSAGAPIGRRLIGGVGRKLNLAPGEAMTITFILMWHFPNLRLGLPDDSSGRHYRTRFADASAVAGYVAREFDRLSSLTKLWHDTWYDSTLPYWFLDRTMSNTSTLATTTCHRFGTGRFYAWEGIGCCAGTCTHVWHYAQAVGRLFPEIERDVRERVDFGLGFDAAKGLVQMRAEKNRGPAVDGQCGRILGVYREHQMSADDAFLRRVWPRVKQAVSYLNGHDTDGDGVIDAPQENTLDASWFGQIPWITSLYLATLRAAEEMASELGDSAFAQDCRARFEKGKRNVETRLFNGEYFIQLPDPAHDKAMGTYEACHIDQVLGQSWAWQVGLGRVIDREKTVSALRALYRYNFTPDLTRFLDVFPKGRPYAVAGEGGLVMDSNPRNVPNVFRTEGWQGMYFYECMSGFEHQAASHMIAEGLVLEGLAVTRAIHDRYHAARRNPWNEVECSDHYARAMASYGSFITACGFEYHGSKGHLGFAPRLTPENFRSAFTAAEGWGTFAQKSEAGNLKAEIAVKWGRLRLQSLSLQRSDSGAANSVKVVLNGTEQAAKLTRDGARVNITLDRAITIPAGQMLAITLS